MSLARTTRFSRHARIPGDCPVCLYPLQGRNITQRPCQHMLCTPCYHDGVQLGLKDSSFNADACEQCRNTPCTKTRIGATLITSFPSSKQLFVETSKKDAPRRPRREPDGPRAGSAGSAGTGGHGKSERLVKRKAHDKAKKAKKKAKRTVGGFTLASRGDIRGQGISIPVGQENTCMPDALWSLILALDPDPSLSLSQLRSAIMPADGSDPSVDAAADLVSRYGMELAFRSELNSPRLLWNTFKGLYLLQLHVKTDAGLDSHFVGYLAADGLVVDNYPRSKVPRIEASDRSRKNAPKVFYALFPGASQITLGAVLELRYTPASYGAAISTDSCASGVSYQRIIGPPNALANIWSQPTKPTLEDLFLELYDEQIINYSELIDCIK